MGCRFDVERMWIDVYFGYIMISCELTESGQNIEWALF